MRAQSEINYISILTDIDKTYYSISDGYDYDLMGGGIQFNANKEQGEATDCQGLTVRIHDDPVVEGTEQVQIQLVSPQPDRILVERSYRFTDSQRVTSVVIEDDDGEW